MKRNRFFYTLFLSICLNADVDVLSYGFQDNNSDKNILNENVIYNLIDDNNPFYKQIFLDKKITQAQKQQIEGVFDVNVGAVSEKKDFPTSTAEYNDVSISKKYEDGFELYGKYRITDGVQEYNNIKTGQEGEYQIGFKSALNELFIRENYYKNKLKDLQFELNEKDVEIESKLRDFYYIVFLKYYDLQMLSSITNIHEEILKNLNEQKKILEKRIENGNIAPYFLIEIEEAISEQKQRFLNSKNKLDNSKINFSIILNKDREFIEKYTIENINLNKNTKISFNKEDIINNNIKKQKLELKTKRIKNKENLIETKKYPKVDFFTQGVYDEYYNEYGFKFGINITHPIQRTSYQGEILENITQKEQNTVDKQINYLKIEETLHILNNDINNINKINEEIKKQLDLANKLLSIEKKKLEIGKSNVFMLYQRETKLLNSKIKLIENIIEQKKLLLFIKKESDSLI